MNTWNLLKEWNKLSLKIVFDNYVQWWILNRLIVVIIPQYIQISKNYVEHLKLIGYMSIYLNNFFNVKKGIMTIEKELSGFWPIHSVKYL